MESHSFWQLVNQKVNPMENIELSGVRTREVLQLQTCYSEVNTYRISERYMQCSCGLKDLC